MLRITMNKSAGGAKKYYSEEYYREGQSNELNYYTDANWESNVLIINNIGLLSSLYKCATYAYIYSHLSL